MTKVAVDARLGGPFDEAPPRQASRRLDAFNSASEWFNVESSVWIALSLDAASQGR